MDAKQVIETDIEHITKNLEKEFGKLSGKSLLITGGAGFLGYYLTKSAAYWNKKNKHDPLSITIADNYIRGLPGWIEEIKHEDKNIRILKQDITKPLPGENTFEYIIHAASIASPHYYRLHPIETMDANVLGLRNLLDFALDQKDSTEGFLFYSSSEIYGDPSPENIPTPETYLGNVSCTGPRACYDESKRFGETLCVNFTRAHGLPVKIARPFNNYGPGLRIDDKRAIPDFARDILSNRDIVLYSDGSPTRTFCYIADAIIGYYKILVEGKPGESYNIGTEKPEISILDLVKKMQDIGKTHFEYTGEIVTKKSSDTEYLTDNPNRRCPDITKAREALGYDPEISLDEGLLRNLYWYNENRA